MSSRPPSDRPRRRRWPLRILVGGSVLVVALFLARRPLLAPLLVSQLERIAAEAGGELSVASVGGGFWDDVLLEGIEWSSPQGSVRGGRVHVRFSVWDALRGEPSWLRSIDARALAVELQASASGEKNSTGTFELPRYLPAVSLEVVELRQHLAQGDPIEVTQLALELSAGNDWSLAATHARGSLDANGRYDLSEENQELHVARLELLYGPDRLTSDGLVLPLALTGVSEALQRTQGEFDLAISEATLRERGPQLGLEPALTALRLHAVFGDGGRADLTGSLATRAGGVTLRAGSIEVAKAVDDLRAAAIELDFEADFDSLRPLSELLGREPWEGRLQSRVEVSGSLGNPVVQARVDASRLRVEGFELDFLRLEASRVESEPILFEELTLGGNGSEWSLSRPASVAWTPEELFVEALVLRCRAGEATLSLRKDALRTEIGLGLEDFDLDLLEGLFLPEGWMLGEVSGRVDAHLGEGEHNVSFLLGTPVFRPVPDQPSWSFDAKGRLATDGLSIEQLVGRTEGGVLRARVELPFDAAAGGVLAPGPIGVQAHAQNVDLGVWTELLPPAFRSRGRVSLDAAVGGTWERPTGTLRIETSDLQPASPHFPAELYPLQLALEVELEEHVYVREAAIRAATGLLASFDGRAEIVGDTARWFSRPEELLEVPIALRGTLSAPSLEGLAGLLATVRRAEGRVNASVEVAGTLGQPTWSGEVELVEGELRLATDIPSIRGITARFRVDDHLWRIERLEGELGGAPIRFGGQLDASGEELQLALTFAGERVLLVRTPDTKVRADAELTVTGPLHQLHTTGEVVLTEGRHVRSIDIFQGVLGGSGDGAGGGVARERGISFSLTRTPPLSSMTVDVAVRSESAFKMRNNLVRADFRPELRILGTGELLFLRGPVYVDPSTLSLPSGRLQIQSGTIEFRRDTPFVPELQLTAGMRARGYDIDAAITGPYDNPEIILSSKPPLPNDELLLLFLTGQAPSDLSEDGLGAVETVGVFLAQDALSRWLFEADVDDGDTALDRIDFTMGAEVSRSGSPTARGTYYLEARPSGRGRFEYLRAERDKYDRVNYGFGFLFRFR